MATPERPARDLTPLPTRYCRVCAVWTQCGRCPTCDERLGEPPFLQPMRPGELDIAQTPAGGGRTSCSSCGLAFPFHRSADCPGIPPRDVGAENGTPGAAADRYPE